jgi:GDP-L-fucose synthase
MYSEDMADACTWLMNLDAKVYEGLLGSDESATGLFDPPLINIGVGEDVSIAELARLVADVVGYRGDIVFDPSKPDGTPRKLMDVGKLQGLGWTASTSLAVGLERAYRDFCNTYADF